MLNRKAYSGFPGSSDGKKSACNAGDLGRVGQDWTTFTFKIYKGIKWWNGIYSVLVMVV